METVFTDFCQGEFQLVVGESVFCILNSQNGKIKNLTNCLLSYVIA